MARVIPDTTSCTSPHAACLTAGARDAKDAKEDRPSTIDTLKLRPQEFCLKSVNAPATASLLHITKPHLSSSSSCFMVRSSFLSPSSMNLSSRARYSSRSCSISRRAHVDSRSLNENNYGFRTATARSGHEIVRGTRGDRAERTGRASMVWFRPCEQKHEALHTGESSFDPTTENRDGMGHEARHQTPRIDHRAVSKSA